MKALLIMIIWAEINRSLKLGEDKMREIILDSFKRIYNWVYALRADAFRKYPSVGIIELMIENNKVVIIGGFLPARSI